MAAKSSVAVSLDLDRLVREEATEWFTSNRKDLEIVMRRVADRVREEVEAIYRDENIRLRERVNSLEQIVNVVRTQVVDEDQRRA